jgi:LmbE family N-acetylglucosaminyl deacetylase
MARRNVAVIVAHPDDEVLLAGGAIARHAEAGDKVHILFLATGAAARGGRQTAYIKRLRTQAARAAKVLGAAPPSFHDFPDNRMDTVPLLDVIRSTEAFLAKVVPVLVYTHHAGDLNVDHRIVHQAVLTACRPVPRASFVEILAGETNSATEWVSPGSFAPFQPTDFLDIRATLERKLQALQCYEGETRDWPHPRSSDGVRALARWRGSQVGVDAAEAFMQVRRVRHTP